MIVVVSIIVAFVILVCVCILRKRMNNKEYEIMSSHDKSIKPFKLCGCKELQSNHQSQTEHKIMCPIFSRINPGRTRNELLLACGFSNLVCEEDVPLGS
jgi:hypothetical protein